MKCSCAYIVGKDSIKTEGIKGTKKTHNQVIVKTVIFQRIQFSIQKTVFQRIQFSIQKTVFQRIQFSIQKQYFKEFSSAYKNSISKNSV